MSSLLVLTAWETAADSLLLSQIGHQSFHCLSRLRGYAVYMSNYREHLKDRIAPANFYPTVAPASLSLSGTVGAAI